jgi:hypothetical protein
MIEVWIFSEPTFLGSFDVGEDGSFAATVTIDELALGDHTLQLDGVTADGVELIISYAATALEPSDAAAAPSELPRSGYPITPMLLIAVLITLAGASAILKRRPMM